MMDVLKLFGMLLVEIIRFRSLRSAYFNGSPPSFISSEKILSILGTFPDFKFLIAKSISDMIIEGISDSFSQLTLKDGSELSSLNNCC